MQNFSSALRRIRRTSVLRSSQQRACGVDLAELNQRKRQVDLCRAKVRIEV